MLDVSLTKIMRTDTLIGLFACSIIMACAESEEADQKSVRGITGDTGRSTPNTSGHLEIDSLRERDERILSRISEVQIGMTKQKVREILGNSGERSGSELFYSVSSLKGWIDDAVQVKGYRIYFENGKVKRRETESASYYFAPNPRG